LWTGSCTSKIAVTGRIQTGSYTKDGKKVYTTDVVVEEHEFAESKGSNEGKQSNNNTSNNSSRQQDNEEFEGGFMNIPDGIDEELPFN
jgi:single-strand DNA-binding protein